MVEPVLKHSSLGQGFNLELGWLSIEPGRWGREAILETETPESPEPGLGGCVSRGENVHGIRDAECMVPWSRQGEAL